MKTHPKIKNPPRPLFSCGIFGHCTQTVLSPTTPKPPPIPPLRDPDPPLPASDPHPPSSSSSSSSTSQSFTQWRFPLPKPSLHHPPSTESGTPTEPATDKPSPRAPSPNFTEIFHVAEHQFSSGSDETRLAGLQLLERSLVPDPLPDDSGGSNCPPAVMGGVVLLLKQPPAARAATKVLLALCLGEANRRAAVEAGAVSGVVESVTEMEGAAAERALAALELLCTVPEGAAELRSHALAVPALVEMMGKMGGRGKECAISVLAVIFSGGESPPTGIAQAVLLALQGECSARGRRKGAQLLKAVQENERPDVAEEGKWS
ncbi:U-box domain-containing protein 25 [Aristolochia californica]|uniref:U-box domain-containing protein 25 n=1 Tax=Aristolochia californica TaxID=171875 RepID=UPI0035DF233C